MVWYAPSPTDTKGLMLTLKLRPARNDPTVDLTACAGSDSVVHSSDSSSHARTSYPTISWGVSGVVHATSMDASVAATTLAFTRINAGGGSGESRDNSLTDAQVLGPVLLVGDSHAVHRWLQCMEMFVVVYCVLA